MVSGDENAKSRFAASSAASDAASSWWVVCLLAWLSKAPPKREIFWRGARNGLGSGGPLGWVRNGEVGDGVGNGR